jgi:DNA polymerase
MNFVECGSVMNDLAANSQDRMRTVIVARLDSLRQAGILQLPKVRYQAKLDIASQQESLPALATTRPISATSEATSAASPLSPEAPRTTSSGWQPAGAGSLFSAAESGVVPVSSAPTLDILQQVVAACTHCDELARTRTQTVFGVGNPNAKLCFVGEAPGADEDRLGEPFVGRAGQLLTKIIEACRMKREDVYILNMIKCRPPGNRNPLPDELSNCRGYLERQLALVRPEFICCLGAVAAQNLLGTTLSIGKLRGKVHVHRGAKLVCTYHPAYLLRNPAAKKDTWDDMKLLMREMGVEL